MTRSFAPPAKALPVAPAKRGVTPAARHDRSEIAADEDRWTELAIILLDMLDQGGPEPATGPSEPRAPNPPQPTTTEAPGDTAAMGADDATATPRPPAPLPGGSDARSEG